MNFTRRTFVAASAAAAVHSTKASAGLFGDTPPDLHFILLSNSVAKGGRNFDLSKAALIFALQNEVADRDRPSSSNRLVEIIATGSPSESKFAGTPKQLYGAASDVLKLMELPPKCEDLQLAFGQIQYRIDLLKPKKVEVTTIAPLFTWAVGCSESDRIVIPQTLPAELPLARILADERTVSFRAYMVLAEQQKKVLEHIDSGEGKKRREAGDLKVEMYTPDTTIDAIGYRDQMSSPSSKKKGSGS